MKQIRVIRCDGMFDLSKLSKNAKLILFPVLAKTVGLLRATILLYRPGK